MVANSDLIKATKELADQIVEKSPLWRMKFARPLLGSACLMLHSLAHRLHQLETENIRLRREVKLFPEQRRSAIKDAEKVSNRIELAIYELEENKRNNKREKAAAILLSPYQLNMVRMGARMFMSHKFQNKDGATTFAGIPVYTAKGVYGPVVLTEEGYNAVSRNAPELLLKGA